MSLTASKDISMDEVLSAALSTNSAGIFTFKDEQRAVLKAFLVIASLPTVFGKRLVKFPGQSRLVTER